MPLGAERLTAIVQLTFANYRDTATEAREGTLYIVEEPLQCQSLLRKINKVRRIRFAQAGQAGSSRDLAGVAAEYFDDLYLAPCCLVFVLR